MNEENATKLKSFEINLEDETYHELLNKELLALRDKGISNITVTIKGSVKEIAKELKVDLNVFNKIRTTQDLPDWVVLDLLRTKGAIREKDD
jgi:hypothetical protein